MKFFVLTIMFCAGVVFSSQAHAQTEHSVAEAQPLVEVGTAKVNEVVISTSYTDECCCRPMKRVLKRVFCAPVNAVHRVQETRPVRSAVCCVKQKRPVRRVFGRVFGRCCCN